MSDDLRRQMREAVIAQVGHRLTDQQITATLDGLVALPEIERLKARLHEEQQWHNAAIDTYHAGKALRDAIPGDDKLTTVQWAVKIARRALRAEYPTTAIHLGHDCPPSVRAALRSSGGES